MGDVTVIDVATKWEVDAALFFTLAVGFLVWGLASGSASAYAFAGAGWIAIAGAVPAVLTLWWGGAALVGGLFAGTGIARLLGVRRLRRLEQARHIRLSVSLGRGQRRKHTFYSRPDLGI